MGIYRTYIDKSNTLISNSEVNTSRNEIIQLYYGSGHTRHIFKVDFTKLSELKADGLFDNEPVKHILRFKNTSNFDINPKMEDYNHLEFSGKIRATSFSLELHKLTEGWTEGDGYAYERPDNERIEDKEFVFDVSNWTKASGNTNWTTAGAISTGSTAIATATFDRGYEDIEFDITDYVNGVLSGDTDNGLLIKFADEFENLSFAAPRFVGFFSKNTNTYFEPFIETTYSDYINDSRNNFILNQENKLYFYANVNGNFVNLDSNPTVVVNNVSGYTVTRETKGVYSVTVPISGTTGMTDNTMYSDVWTFTYNGSEFTETLKFVPKKLKSIFTTNDNLTKTRDYDITAVGINYNEDVIQGEIKRVQILLKSIYQLSNHNIDDIEYKMYMLNGKSHYDIIEWSKVNKGANTNYLLLDTSWLLPQTYYIDFKVSENNEVKFYNKKIKFNLVNNYNKKFEY